MKWLKRLTVIVGTFYRYRLAGLCASLMGSGWICALLKMMPQSSKLKNEPPA
ncbi:ubiquinone biosynthesis regulatory protein kinase UbiB, partial [Neisseria meningitidis]